jgi:hypothetical protein
MEMQKISKTLTFSDISIELMEGIPGWSEEESGGAGQESEDLQILGALFIHFFKYHQALCGKDLDISYVLNPVDFAVNFILGHAVNLRHF